MGKRKQVGLTKLEEEKEIKRKLGEEMEKIEAMGQDNEEKAAKWVKEDNAIEINKQNEQRRVETEILEAAKKSRFEYWRKLCMVARSVMVEFDVPKGFIWGANLKQLDNDECGLIIWFRDNGTHKAEVAMRISGEPKYDLNWIDRRIFDTLDLMDNISTPKTQEGIILPN